MDIKRLGMEVASLCNLMKAASLYAEDIRSHNVSFEYKNACTSVIRTYQLLEKKLKMVNPAASKTIEDELDNDRIHYISETVLLMSSIGVEGCKEIFETLKRHIEE